MPDLVGEWADEQAALMRRVQDVEARLARAVDAVEVIAVDRCTTYRAYTRMCADKWPGEMGDWCASCCARVALAALTDPVSPAQGEGGRA